MAGDEPFHGAKVALFLGERLLVLLRDDFPHIEWPGHWDFPGGGRDGGETPWQTLAREVREEVGLDMDRAEVLWQQRAPSADRPGTWTWFYVARMAPAPVRMGDEGQGWALVTPERFLTLPDAVPSLKDRLGAWLSEAGRKVAR